MTGPHPKLNIQGWEVTPATSNTVKLPMLIEVPAGEFLMGTSDENIKLLPWKESDWADEWSDPAFFAAEQPQHRVSLPAFQIAEFPVTNADYQIFIRDMGHRLPCTWTSFTFRDGTGNHPVVGVSKNDAEAYIEWLNKKTGMDLRLPTEAEWERAARGEDGRLFPWGNLFDSWRCNTAEGFKKGTTPVDFYSPGGDSPYGVADMIGNVREWTQSPFMPYPYDLQATANNDKAKGRFVVRGGAWYYTRKLARCAAREGIMENHLFPSIGFRVARSLP